MDPQKHSSHLVKILLAAIVLAGLVWAVVLLTPWFEKDKGVVTEETPTEEKMVLVSDEDRIKLLENMGMPTTTVPVTPLTDEQRAKILESLNKR